MIPQPKISCHGVFIRIFGIGVLITGASGIGKSELALALINRGHQLIADDAPEFSLTDEQTIQGQCPSLLHGFLAIRGLGILNIAKLFGQQAVSAAAHELQIIIHLQKKISTTPLIESSLKEIIFNLEIPKYLLATTHRCLATIVETLIRNHICLVNCYNAQHDFIQRQQTQLEVHAHEC